ncbi:UNVERIFIED_CONTAM: putative mitochondrial protein [Sesamum radiatum]|uniref:Mitochondrial protein n=1 Tax=Sesamum radiatum TaxID=300843 RepID=A0AAW2VPQ1_SESRA
MVDDKEDIHKMILEHFKLIFKTSQPDDGAMNEIILALKPSSVSTEMNEHLLRPFELEEVAQSLKQMHSYKSPGPASISPIFFQHYWNIVSAHVTSCVLDILNGGSLYQKLNHTHIVLIPKVPNPELIYQFRPISLCNVIYKLVSKTIANRLKPLLGSLISPSQSAFVPSRSITDNVLIAYEINHFLPHKTWDKDGHISLKVDVSKAYDYKFGWLTPERGLRQGDPLSPYLYMFCAEALSALIRCAEEDGRIKGVAIARNAPRVSHLLFADDTLIFCQASREKLEEVHRLLGLFAKASGKSKREIGESVKERIWEKLNNWTVRKLSQAGQEVLIKTVIQAILVYVMGCFRGLGFRQLKEYNMALLAKQAWRKVTEPDLLLHKVLRHLYFPGSNFFAAEPGQIPSFT